MGLQFLLLLLLLVVVLLARGLQRREGRRPMLLQGV